MSVYFVEGEILQDIADAVREKKGSSEIILTEDMANEIRGIGGGSTGGANKLSQIIDRSVTEITAEDLRGATKIGKNAFFYCVNLTVVVISEGVTGIGDEAFVGCLKLQSVTIPSTVESIDTRAFYGLSALKYVTIKATTPPTIAYNVFSYGASDRVFIVPRGCGNAYKNATNWSALADIIVEGDV